MKLLLNYNRDLIKQSNEVLFYTHILALSPKMKKHYLKRIRENK